MIPFVYIIMGVSGSGKSTVGEALAARLNCPFYDGDDFKVYNALKGNFETAFAEDDFSAAKLSAGTNIVAAEVSIDLDGNARPDGDAFDIGCYELSFLILV